MQLEKVLDIVRPLDKKAMGEAEQRLNGLHKPLKSLGRLEDIVIQLAGIFGTAELVNLPKALAVCCADNGVADEIVSQVPKAMTPHMARSIGRGLTGVSVLGKFAGADSFVYDFGMESVVPDSDVIDMVVRRGTDNIAYGPAMTEAEALECIFKGIEIVGALKSKGYGIIATGELGIANTTTSSAVASVLTGVPVNQMVGVGCGIDEERLAKKKRIVARAIEVNKPDPTKPIEVLSRLGGFDIAAMTGLFLGGAVHRLPIVIDGFISSAAALVAQSIWPQVTDFMLPSHGSAEPGHKKMMEKLGMEPMLNMRMRLGEGSGAVLALVLVDAALAIYNEMGVLEDIGMDVSML